MKVHLEHIYIFITFLNTFLQQTASLTDISVFQESGISRWAVNCYCSRVCLLVGCHDGPHSWWKYFRAGTEYGLHKLQSECSCISRSTGPWFVVSIYFSEVEKFFFIGNIHCIYIYINFNLKDFIVDTLNCMLATNAYQEPTKDSHVLYWHGKIEVWCTVRLHLAAQKTGSMEQRH